MGARTVIARSYRDIEETFMQVSGLTDEQHRQQISAVMVEVFAEGARALERLRNSQADLSRTDRHDTQLPPSPPPRRTHDNLATELAPVWRGRLTTPLTPWAVRRQLIAQAEGKTDDARRVYVSRRLTPLDRALNDDEASALEEWLLCQEMLAGRAKGQSWGDTAGGGATQRSPIPDRMMRRLQLHARLQRHMPARHQITLQAFAAMMRDPLWDFGPRPQQRRTIAAIRLAAAWLVEMSCRTNARQDHMDS